MNEEQSKWLWRGLLFVLMGVTLRVVLSLILGTYFFASSVTTIWQYLGGNFKTGVHLGKSVAFTLPSLVCCFVVFDFLARRADRAAEESCCRRCGHILRGLSKPRCPECGEAI